MPTLPVYKYTCRRCGRTSLRGRSAKMCNLRARTTGLMLCNGPLYRTQGEAFVRLPEIALAKPVKEN
jgi:hypothetical protein